MGKIKRKLFNLMVKLYVSTTGSSLRQGENLAPEGRSAATAGMSELLIRAAAEGAVLLKNDGTLPLNGKTALFGRVQTDTFYTGYGSGGDVVKPYRVSILEGMEADPDLSLDKTLSDVYRTWAKAHPVDHGYWGNWPRAFPEMPIDESLVEETARRAQTAVVVIGRAAGEDRENELKEGSFYLTSEEKRLLDLVTKRFRRTAVLLNIGNIIDLSFLETYGVNAALLLWQGGMETGNAAARLLSGKINPCGKLSSTVARRYENYPSAAHFGGLKENIYAEDIYVGYRYFETFEKESVLYPFGFGMSYTTFSVSAGYRERKVCYRVKNTGSRAGREVVQVYVGKPRRKKSDPTFCNPARELVGFCKTKLLAPGEEEEGEIALSMRSFCSYDSEKSAYVALAGVHEIFAGVDVRSAEKIGEESFAEDTLVEQCGEECAPPLPFGVLGGERTEIPVRTRKKDVRADILSSLPPAIKYTGDKGYKLAQVKSGRVSMRDFIAQLSLEELEALSRGDYVMDSPLGASGNAGVYGGVLPSLREKGIPPVTATDGPSGIRLKCASSLVPIGTLLACTFDEALVGEVYAAIGGEMRSRGSDVLLAPAINLQRNPLCGRNFEYFSEDPYLTGKLAAAAVRGVQSTGVSACPKHFACNNQELNRNRNDSRVSERALRELYLYGFEICVKEGKPQNLMTSYNKINGVWAHYHYELVRGILRGEWGFDGCVITDWWMRSSKSPEFPKLKRNAYRVRAGVNVLMPGGGHLGRRKPDGTLLGSLGKEGGITLGELQRNSEEILRFIMNSPAMERTE